MSEDMHPQVAAVLKQAQRLQSLMDDQLDRMTSQTFMGTDESETVEVTLNGHQWLTDVFISDGLLRLGADTVSARLNEALLNAGAHASAAIDADRTRIDAEITEITEITEMTTEPTDRER